MSRIADTTPLPSSRRGGLLRRLAQMLWAPREFSIRPAHALAAAAACVAILLVAYAFASFLERATGGQCCERSAAVRAVPPGHRGVESPALRAPSRIGSRATHLRESAPGTWTITVPLKQGVHDYPCRRRAAVGPRSSRAADRRRVRRDEQPSCSAVSNYAQAVTNGAVTAALMVSLVALIHATAARGQGGRWTSPPVDSFTSRCRRTSAYSSLIGSLRYAHAAMHGCMEPLRHPGVTARSWGAAGTGGRV